ncbi:hypothetical protein [Sulfitobacter pacificus]|uniref:Uncharacterized protein n=1 Tax=Sulfitobacter pacificus TaxID=1499314 RepID=A0ABQ5VD57_9RHOB|nr:hypothetical protein [Sulfitobacter pacificus]GLQ25451.1 hypothetical protein GCM10007927_02540 [Sulfitobacter pacificus]
MHTNKKVDSLSAQLIREINFHKRSCREATKRLETDYVYGALRLHYSEYVYEKSKNRLVALEFNSWIEDLEKNNHSNLTRIAKGAVDSAAKNVMLIRRDLDEPNKEFEKLPATTGETTNIINLPDTGQNGFPSWRVALAISVIVFGTGFGAATALGFVDYDTLSFVLNGLKEYLPQKAN